MISGIKASMYKSTKKPPIASNKHQQKSVVQVMFPTRSHSRQCASSFTFAGTVGRRRDWLLFLPPCVRCMPLSPAKIRLSRTAPPDRARADDCAAIFVSYQHVCRFSHDFSQSWALCAGFLEIDRAAPHDRCTPSQHMSTGALLS